ncbi:hypothetical protein E3N88_43521 [Mikania micrantha]|uniref:Uncharacterized protein n=1 Tax=Mikania micrantha TaxID=192012 RepID=A0A5N6LEU4_9ASTR|nr:hypothetical protein E3N88_43521 [Mikania micrantha]
MDASPLSTLHCDLAAQLGKTRLVDQKKLKLHSMGKEEDLAVALSKLVEDAENFNIHRFKCALEIKSLLIQATAYGRSYAEKFMASSELEMKIKEMEASIKQQEKVALQESLHFEQCKKEMEDYRQQLAAATRAAESVTVITPALEHEFLQVVELSVKLESIEQELIASLEELSSLKGKCLPILRNLVAQIKETFSRNFQEMVDAGEVSLDELGNDFDSYGIQTTAAKVHLSSDGCGSNKA